jgi:hypothetical protein
MRLFKRHDLGVRIAKCYRPGIYYERNKLLVDHSSELLCWDHGSSGGTKYTVDRAIEQHKPMINIADIL